MKRKADEFDLLPAEERIAPEIAPMPEEFSIPPEEMRDSKTGSSRRSGSSDREDDRTAKRNRKLLSMLAMSTVTVSLALSVTGPTHRDSAKKAEKEIFEINGQTTIVDEGMVLLTDDTRQIYGGIISEGQISPDSEISFDYFMSYRPDKVDRNGAAGDGFAVAFTDTRDMSGVLCGGGLGYQGLVGVEFDLVHNPQEETPGFDKHESFFDHVAIIGSSPGIHRAVAERGKKQTSLDDGRWHEVKITWTEGILQAEIDSAKAVSAPAPELDHPVYLSVTGANGDGTCYICIADLRIDGTPVEYTGKSPAPENVTELRTVIDRYQEYLDRGRAPIWRPFFETIFQAEREEIEKAIETKEQTDRELTEDAADAADETRAKERTETSTEDYREPETILPVETEAVREKEARPITYVTCSECGGSGIYCPGDPNFGLDRGNGNGYAGCGGTGYSPCPDSWCHNGIRTCQSCRGSGKAKHGDCEICSGTGINPCEFCGGSGTARCISIDSHRPCEVCNGTGKVEN